MLASLPLYFLSCYSLFLFLFGVSSEATGRVVSLGAIIDCDSHIGKQEKISMQMAIDDFYKNSRKKPLLHIRNSGGSPAKAAFAAVDLIEKQKVQAILGFQNSDEATLVGELGNKFQVPILSFVSLFSPGSFRRWPFLISATQPKHSQMSAIAAIIGTWQWRRVNFLYEDTMIYPTAITISSLIKALQEVDCEIENLMPLLPQPSLLSKELKKLRDEGQSRVFIVHSSLSLAENIFKEAKKLGMMEEGSVWITTDVLTDLLDSASSSMISSMQGVVGIKSYFPRNGKRFKDFSKRFRTKFRLEYAKEMNPNPGIFSSQAYDAVWAVALAMEARTLKRAILENSTNDHHQEDPLDYDQKILLEELLDSKFEGLTERFHFEDGELAPARRFQLVNVVGKSYREVGFWSDKQGFSRNTSEKAKYNTSMEILGEIFWPGGPLLIPRGWALPTSERPLRIGVPGRSAFTQFVNVVYNNSNRSELINVEGSAIDVFKEALQLLPNKFPYKFFSYDGTYDQLVEQISNKEVFDVVVGDTSIVAYRCKYAEFSHPWSEPGIRMVVYKKSVKSNNKAWLFMKPFSTRLWACTAGISIFNGLVIWLIERTHNQEFRGTIWNQIGSLIWLAFSTLFAQHGDRLQSNFSKMILVVWFFVAIIIINSYTASLTTLLTVPQLKPSVNINDMKNEVVGCDGGSFIVRYLVEVLHFSPKNIKTIPSYEDYPEAFMKGEIKAAFLNVPHTKVFLSKYCNDFTAVDTNYNVGGFGFVFPRRSPMLPDFSKAILELRERGRLQELENEMIKSNNNCSSSDSKEYHSNNEDNLDLTSFWGLFVITGGTSVVSIGVFVLMGSLAHKRSQQVFDEDEPLVELGMLNDHNPLIDEVYMFAPELMDAQEYV